MEFTVNFFYCVCAFPPNQTGLQEEHTFPILQEEAEQNADMPEDAVTLAEESSEVPESTEVPEPIFPTEVQEPAA